MLFRSKKGSKRLQSNADEEAASKWKKASNDDDEAADATATAEAGAGGWSRDRGPEEGIGESRNGCEREEGVQEGTQSQVRAPLPRPPFTLTPLPRLFFRKTDSQRAAEDDAENAKGTPSHLTPYVPPPLVNF